MYLLRLIQDVVYHPATPWGVLVMTILSGLIAWLSVKAYDGIKTIWPWWDKQPALYHQIAAPIFQFIFGAIGSVTGTTALTDVHSITSGWIGGLLTVLLAGGLKRWEKAKAPADATVVLEASRKASASANLSPAKVGRTRRPPAYGSGTTSGIPMTGGGSSTASGGQSSGNPGSVDRPTSPGT
jgi:hypothetical protein